MENDISFPTKVLVVKRPLKITMTAGKTKTAHIVRIPKGATTRAYIEFATGWEARIETLTDISFLRRRKTDYVTLKKNVDAAVYTVNSAEELNALKLLYSEPT